MPENSTLRALLSNNLVVSDNIIGSLEMLDRSESRLTPYKSCNLKWPRSNIPVGNYSSVCSYHSSLSPTYRSRSRPRPLPDHGHVNRPSQINIVIAEKCRLRAAFTVCVKCTFVETMELSFLRFGLGPTFPDGEKKITLQIFVTKLCNRRLKRELAESTFAPAVRIFYFSLFKFCARYLPPVRDTSGDIYISLLCWKCEPWIWMGHVRR